MKIILKPIFEWLIDGYVLFENELYNYVAIAIVGVIAFIIAWSIVGNLYESSMIRSKSIGSIIHWIIRFLVFFILSIMIRFIRFISTIPLWIWVILIIVGVILFLIIKRQKYKMRD